MKKIIIYGYNNKGGINKMNIKEEKGSMAVYVTIVLLSMLLILSAVFLTSERAFSILP